MPSQTFLSVIIPAYNEEKRLRKTMPLLRDFLKKQSFAWEVVLIDDGSTDNTAQAPAGFFTADEARVFRNERNRGKGYSVRQGVQAARGEILLFTDADLSTPLNEFDKLHACLQQGYDIAIGSRSLPGSNVTQHQAWYRESMGKVFNKIVNLIVLEGFVDTQCGFKCFRKEVAVPIFSKMIVDRFGFDVEFLYLARKAGNRIIEVPVEWHDVLHSRVRIVRDSLQMFLDLFRIRWNDWTGKYD